MRGIRKSWEDVGMSLHLGFPNRSLSPWEIGRAGGHIFRLFGKGCGAANRWRSNRWARRLERQKRNQTITTYFERSVVHFEDTLQVGDDDELLASFVVDNLVDATPERLDAGEMQTAVTD